MDIKYLLYLVRMWIQNVLHDLFLLITKCVFRTRFNTLWNPYRINMFMVKHGDTCYLFINEDPEKIISLLMCVVMEESKNKKRCRNK